MPDNNEIETDSTHSEAVPPATEIAEKDRSESKVQSEPGDTSNWFGSVFGVVSAKASAVGNAMTSAGGAIANTASVVGNVAASAGSTAMQVPNFLGSALDLISQSPILKKTDPKV